jgi:hypothetical protein
MKLDDWIAAVNKEMLHFFGINLTDSGFTEKEFFERYGNQRPLSAVLDYGDDFDLSRRNFW